mmetsp:Transcript_2869/g.10148  ORF Transcript_2869/g.10148 Transcript_2869/m.10148 type:complete len:1131 (-) Transcript_2869:105-3497(-)
MAASDSKDVDTNLYSRQIGVYGMETMGKLIKMDVLVVGMRGVGVEVAKNLVLAGPHSVVVFDPTPAAVEDLGANFYLTAADVGRPRAEVVAPRLAELNNYVAVQVLAEAALTEEVLDRFHAVVFTDTPRSDLARWNEYCHAHAPPIAFVAADVMGAAGYAFSDFGPGHLVMDTDGEPTKTHIVTAASEGAPGTIVVHDDKLLSFAAGDFVKFSEVEGMTGLNTQGPHRVTKVQQRLHSFELESTVGMGAYAGGGLVEPIKVPVVARHATLREATVDPTGGDAFKMDVPDHATVNRPDQTRAAFAGVTAFRDASAAGDELPDLSKPEHLDACVRHAVAVGGEDAAVRALLRRASVSRLSFDMITPDFGKFGRPQQLHVAFQAVEAFRDKHGALPALHDAAHADECVALAEEFNAAQKAAADGGARALVLEEVDADVVRTVARLARAELQPLCAVYGGIVAQEVVKQTGKFSPLGGWLYLDAFEVLPTEELPAEETAPAGTRYDHGYALFGRRFMKRLADVKLFLVGAGALGCEFLKAFALMGVAAGDGLVTVTDMDTIEVSNLNRQFLFRSKDVGQMKSTTAAAAAKAMNGDFRVEALTDKMAPDTEDKYDDVFWRRLDGVCNALDNVAARLYMDSRCVRFCKPLLESGTLGTKGNNLTCIPRATESYASQPDAPDTDIPACTLKSFPNLIEHTLQWARDAFELYFHNNPAEVNAYLGRADYMAYLDKQRNAKVERLRTLAECLGDNHPTSFADCVRWARARFEDMFNHKIKDLLHQYPLDHMSGGQPFWSAKKRPPTPLDFDLADPLHAQFVVAAACLHARTYGIAETKDLAVFADALAGYEPPAWAPSTDRIPENEEEAKKLEEAKAKAMEEGGGGGDLDDMAAQLLTRIPPVEALGGFRACVADFEKDDDGNGHMDFIAATGNLRARQYNIPEADALKAKQIVGRIIPAIATTTALTTGLVSIELYKALAAAPLEAMRNSFGNLAINMFAMSEPMPPKKVTSCEFDVTIGGPVKAVPEGFSSWDKDVVAEGDITVQEFCDLYSAKGLEVSMIAAGEKMLYSPMMFRKHAERAHKKLSQVYFDVVGPTPRDYFMLDLTVEDDDGDVIIPPVQFYYRGAPNTRGGAGGGK